MLTKKQTILTSNFQLNRYTLFVVLLSCVLNACNIDVVHKIDQPVNIAKTISNSKELGLFLGEYNPVKVNINDTIQFDIIQAWVEYNFYYSDLENDRETKLQKIKLKKNFTPINGAHVSFLVKEDLMKKYCCLFNNVNENDIHWELEYYEIIKSDTLNKDKNTYLESYGPIDYQNLPDSIAVILNHFVPSLDSTKYGSEVEFARFYLTKKRH